MACASATYPAKAAFPLLAAAFRASDGTLDSGAGVVVVSALSGTASCALM